MTIDHSHGRILKLDGNVFYSPNCSRTVELPPIPSANSHNVFNNYAPRLRDFRTPKWWTQELGWLAFVTLRPSFTGYPLDRLAIPISVNIADPEKYCLSPSIATSWLRLDNCLVNATSHLISLYKQPVIRPFAPWALGYLSNYSSTRSAYRHASYSRDWFVVWMALLSHLIAIDKAGLHQEVAPVNAPSWFEALANLGFDQSWLGGILTSIICNFSNATPRVGVFIDICTPAYGQPPPEWFTYHHIPIWYPWGTKEQKLADRSPRFAQFSPSHHPRAQTLLFTPSPFHTSPIQSHSLVPQYIHSDSHAIQTDGISHASQSKVEKLYRPWQEFFAQRKQRNAEKEKRETPDEHQKRLQRTTTPPVKNAKVFIWASGDDPDTSDNQLHRQPVSKKYNEETIRAYSIAQRRYDPFENEWDLCKEFGPDDPDDVGVNNDDNNDGRIGPIIQPLNTNNRSISPGPINTEDEEWSPPWSRTSDLVRTIAERFGFTPPLVASSKLGPIQPKDWKDYLRIAGLPPDPADTPASAFDHDIITFLQKLAEGKRPLVDEWDLNAQNRCFIANSGRFNSVHVMPGKGFIIDFPKTKLSFPWTLLVPHGVDALFICRLDPTLNQYEVARYLIEDGIPFRTLLPLRMIPQLPQPLIPITVLPIRLPGYKFSLKDYTAYEQHRTSVLALPNARAALLRGGISWRLARDSLSLDDALQGPSVKATVSGEGFSIQQDGYELWDDELAKGDLDSISGVYYCYTGEGAQIAMKSWWPLQSTWEQPKCGENYGRWTQVNEAWYQKRLEEIKAGTAEPLTASKWRDRLRGLQKTRVIQTNISKFALDILSER